MDRIQELLTRLADLSDAEIAELEGLILSEFDSVEAEEPTNDSVERMVRLADALDSVRGEVGRRNERAQELAQQASEASARVHASRKKPLPRPRWPPRTTRTRRSPAEAASHRGRDRRGHRSRSPTTWSRPSKTPKPQARRTTPRKRTTRRRSTPSPRTPQPRPSCPTPDPGRDGHRDRRDHRHRAVQ